MLIDKKNVLDLLYISKQSLADAEITEFEQASHLKEEDPKRARHSAVADTFRKTWMLVDKNIRDIVEMEDCSSCKDD